MTGPGRLQRIRMALFPRRVGKSADASRPLDWSTDDMAECVTDGPWFDGVDQVCFVPARGHVAIVREVLVQVDHSGRPAIYLGFDRFPDRLLNAVGFRKLTPRADAACAAEPAFIQNLKGRTLPSPATPSFVARLKRILS